MHTSNRNMARYFTFGKLLLRFAVWKVVFVHGNKLWYLDGELLREIRLKLHVGAHESALVVKIRTPRRLRWDYNSVVIVNQPYFQYFIIYYTFATTFIFTSKYHNQDKKLSAIKSIDHKKQKRARIKEADIRSSCVYVSPT